MTLAQPLWLLLLPLAALPWLPRRGSRALPLPTLRWLGSAQTPQPARLSLAQRLLRTLAIALALVALARPEGPGRWVEERRFGLDIMLALDISGSMRAEDFEPDNRLEAAKHVLKDFIARNADNRIGLVAFAGKSLTLCPLTTDTHVVSQVVDRVNFGSVNQDGTAIGDGIGNCLYRLDGKGAKSKVIVLLSDGKTNSGYLQPMDAALMARERHVRIYTIAVGRPGGAPIPLTDAFGRKVYVRNRDGSLFLPPIDEDALSKIAQLTGGRYFRAADTASLKAAYQEIAALERSEIPVERHRVPADRHTPFALAALLMALLELAITLGAGPVLEALRRPRGLEVTE